jgi:putative DNA primase/helicase
MGDDLRQAVEERIEEELAAMPDFAKAGDDFNIDKLVRVCLNYNSEGDAFLFAHIHKDRFLYNTTSDTMMVWNGHSWVDDEYFAHYAAVTDVANLYNDAALKLWDQIKECKNDGQRKKLAEEQDKLRKRAFQLRGPAVRDACIKFFKRMEGHPMAVNTEKFDSNPMLLGGSNGVIELRTGKFRDGKQKDYISKACPTEFKGIDFPSPMWEEFLLQVFDGDKELVAYLQRLLGYGITGLVREHIFPVFQGRGRNGKGTIIEVLNYVLGGLAKPIRTEMLLAQPFTKSASAPTPEIMTLKGLRMAIASETEEYAKFSASQIKLLTGGDMLIARSPHDKRETCFNPSHLLILMTNDKPKAPGGDFAFWERVHLLHFPLSFVSEPSEKNERPVIKGLAEKLKQEASGILAWLVRGCLQWQVDGGLNPPEKVKAATAEYQKEEDLLAGFIEDCCETDPQYKTKSKELYDAFFLWFEEKAGKRVPVQKTFGKLMGKKFDRCKSNGLACYAGIALRPDIEEIQQEYKIKEGQKQKSF